MRIGILTFHYADNLGCVLQCFALQEAVKKIRPDATVEIINFKRIGAPKKDGVKIERVKDPERVVRSNLFRDFREQYLNIVGEMKWDPDEIDPHRYDICIVGSDQVWNDQLVKGREKAYFLRFADNNTKKISYAASIGSVAEDNSRLEWLLEWIDEMDAISVREESSRDIIQKKTSKSISACVDPTMLQDGNFWEALERKPDGLGEEQYILLYSLGYAWCRENEERAAKMASMMAEKYKLKVIHYYYGKFGEWLPKGSRHCFCEGPQELLWLFHHAEFVVTSTFHGTVFSLLYERPFYSFHVPDNGVRMRDLLASLGLRDRYLEDVIPEDEWDWDIQWDEVNDLLQKKRAFSLEYLDRAINGHE